MPELEPALLIVNPAAQSVRTRVRDEVIRRLRTRLDLSVAPTEDRGHATELAAKAVIEGVSLVVVMGGDGTLNEAVNGLDPGEVRVAILPGGGTNVFARSLGLPRDPLAAVDRVLAGLDRPPRVLPLGRVDDRLFVANCGVGFDAAIVKEVDRRRDRGRKGGEWYYLWAGVRLFFTRYDRRQAHLRVDAGNGEPRRLFLAIVQNTDPYTYFRSRPLRLCPGARLGDRLHLFGLDSMATPTAVRVLLSAFTSGRHMGRPHVAYLPERREIRISCDRPMDVQADGEYLGRRSNVVIATVPGGLPVVA